MLPVMSTVRHTAIAVRLLPFAIVLSACHSSCGDTAESNLTVVVNPDAAAMPNTPPFSKRQFPLRPAMRTVTTVNANQGQD